MNIENTGVFLEKFLQYDKPCCIVWRIWIGSLKNVDFEKKPKQVHIHYIHIV
jgi:hypothetical protein